MLATSKSGEWAKLDVGVESWQLVRLRIDKNVGYSYSFCLLLEQFDTICTSWKRLKRLIQSPDQVFTRAGQKRVILLGLPPRITMRRSKAVTFMGNFFWNLHSTIEKLNLTAITPHMQGGVATTSTNLQFFLHLGIAKLPKSGEKFTLWKVLGVLQLPFESANLVQRLVFFSWIH